MFTDLVRFKDLGATELDRWQHLIDCQPGYESPFFHPHFTRTVSDFRKDTWVILHGQNNEIDLILPIQKMGRVAEPVGAPFSDYHGPIITPEWEGNFSSILSDIGLSTYRFTSLYDVKQRFSAFAAERDGTYVCDISKGADQFFKRQQSLYPKHSKKMRRLSKKIEREAGTPIFLFQDYDQASWDQLINWKRRQYRSTGCHDVMGPDWVRSMLRSLWLDGVEGCQGVFHTIKIDERLIAAEFNLFGRKTIHSWIPAYDQEFRSFAPGYLLQDEVIREAANRGFHDYDLGTSAGYYKKYYAQFQLPVISGSIRSEGRRDNLSKVPGTAWRYLERSNIPKLAPLAGKVRRRYDMIRSVETSFSGKLKGVAAAAGQILRPNATSDAPDVQNSED